MPAPVRIFQDRPSEIFPGGEGIQKADLTGIYADALIRCPDMATMRTMDPLSAGHIVALAGYWTPGDRGGGLFYWDNGAVASDNGGTVIRSSRSGGGRWKRIFDGWINARWFGARGDGVNDDTVAFVNALSAVPTTGGTLYAPYGRYPIGTVLSVGTHPIRITGDGRGSELIVSTGANPLIQRSGHSDSPLRVDNLGFSFNGGNNAISIDGGSLTSSAYDEAHIDNCWFQLLDSSTWGINLSQARSVRVSHCTFVSVTGVVGTGIYLEESVNPFIEHCTFVHNEYGIRYAGDLTNFGYNAGPLVFGCKLLNCTTGIQLEFTDGAQIVDCVVDFCDHPIRIFGSVNIQISGNFCSSRNDNACLEIRPDGAATAYLPAVSLVHAGTQGSNAIAIIGNKLINHESGAVANIAVVEFDDVYDVHFIGNEVVLWEKYGVRYNNSTDQQYIANHFDAEPGFGTNPIIAVAGDGRGNVIQMNRYDLAINCQGAIVDGNWNEAGVAFTRNTWDGQATVAAGNTVVTVSHGLMHTPRSVIVTPQGDPGGRVWVTNLTTTTFDIVLQVAAGGGGQLVNWQAKTSLGSQAN